MLVYYFDHMSASWRDPEFQSSLVNTLVKKKKTPPGFGQDYLEGV